MLCCVSLQNCRSISIIAHVVQLQTKFPHVFIQLVSQESSPIIQEAVKAHPQLVKLNVAHSKDYLVT